MLKFFRRIRKFLLNSGAIRKYFLYAIGEILLVMIGILLALSVNNWNEWRKERKQEIHSLSEIAETVFENINIIDTILYEIEMDLNSSAIIIDAVENGKVSSDTLYNHFFKASWIDISRFMGGLSMESYEFLKNQGLDLVTNNELRKSVISLFEKSMPVYKSEIDDYQKKVNPSIIQLRELFYTQKVENGQVSWKPFDHEKLIGNNFYYSLLKGYEAFRIIQYERTLKFKEETKFVFQLIKDELGEDL